MTIDIAKLKAAAEKARWGNWSAYKPHKGARGYEVRVGCEAVAQHCLKDDADFIAEASPKVVLELIAALEAKDAQIAERDGALEREREKSRRMASRIAELGARTVKLPAFDGYQEHIVSELQAAFRIACGNAGINLETGGE